MTEAIRRESQLHISETPNLSDEAMFRNGKNKPCKLMVYLICITLEIMSGG